MGAVWVLYFFKKNSDFSIFNGDTYGCCIFFFNGAVFFFLMVSAFSMVIRMGAVFFFFFLKINVDNINIDTAPKHAHH